MRLGLYGDGIFRYTNKSQVINGFKLNDPKDECLDNYGRLGKIERINILDKTGLGSLPDQNIFKKVDSSMNENDNEINKDNDQNDLLESEVNKAMQLVRNISDQSLNNEEKSKVKGETSNIFN